MMEVNPIFKTSVSLHHHLAQELQRLRKARAYSLEALAERSGVSRSMISLIERGESSPTAVVLDKLAAALGVPLAALFTVPESSADAAPLHRREQQVSWRDPASGYVRRQVSPPAWSSGVTLTEVHFPGGQRVAFDLPHRQSSGQQQIWLLEGAVEVTVDGRTWALAPGDCLAMDLRGPITFHNPGTAVAHYLLATTSAP
jgi:transcriptional regulator with XRE-family HTH domain